MGNQPIPCVPPRRRKTALQSVQDQYALGERDLDGLERGVEWLLKNGLEDSCGVVAAHWPMSADDPLPLREQFPQPVMDVVQA